MGPESNVNRLSENNESGTRNFLCGPVYRQKKTDAIMLPQNRKVHCESHGLFQERKQDETRFTWGLRLNASKPGWAHTNS